MKINGKSLPQIFSEMSLSEKIIVTVGCIFLLYATIYLPLTFVQFVTRDTSPPEPFRISGMSEFTGFSDPSMAVAGDGKKALLAFTALSRPKEAGSPARIEVRIASATLPACNRWTPVQGGFQSRAEEIVGPDGVTPVKKGIWRAETPSIIYDPTDPGREWKLFGYRYFWADSTPLARLYSMIIYATASKDTMQWSQEEWLFSANRNAPPTPYDALIQTHLNELHPSLANVYFYSRPSATMLNGEIYITLSAFIKGRESVERIVMIKSSDHGRNWEYVGTPLTSDDVAKMGAFTNLAGGTLLQHEGKPYLAIVLGDQQVSGKGTYVVPFKDVSQGLLMRGADGAPAVNKHIPLMSELPSPAGGGFATHSDACKAGVITSEFSRLQSDFYLFKTNKPPVEE